MPKFIKSLCYGLLFFSFLFAQQLVTSRDSILIFPPADPNAHYEGDTITVYNTGLKTLIIDSLLTKKEFSYPLFIHYNDSTRYYSISWFIPYHQSLDFELPPADSALFVFGVPDLCPICKRADSLKGNFEDSIYIYSNSIDQDVKRFYVTGIGMETAIEQNPSTPSTTYLFQNYPNPFNAVTRFSFYLSKAGFVELEIFDVRGRKLKTVFKGHLSSGKHYFLWNAANFTTGLYFYRLSVQGKHLSGKCLLIK